MIQTIESYTPFDKGFLDFWGPGEIPDRGEYHKILMCLDCMTGFGIIAVTGINEITSDQVAQWVFVDFFVPLGVPKMIVVDADRLFS